MIRHVAYEVAALEFTCQLFERTGDRFAFEAFLLHARSVRDFLWREAKYASDAVAEQFFAIPEDWRKAKGPPGALLQRTWTPIDRQLAHLTWDRADPGKFVNLEPLVPGLATELLAQWGRFLGRLSTADAELLRNALETRRSEVRTRVAAPTNAFRGHLGFTVAHGVARLFRVLLVDDIDRTLFFARLAARETARVGISLDHLKEVVVFVEDRRFYEHAGVSIRSVARAAASLLGLKRRSGGSTITQQLVRTLFIRDMRKVYRRKPVEILLALWFERLSTKEEILDLYLSSVRFAPAAFGVTEAMKTFFGGIVVQPSKAQAFFLVERVSNLGRSMLCRKIDHTLRQAVDHGVLEEGDAHEAIAIYGRMVADAKLKVDDVTAFGRLTSKWGS